MPFVANTPESLLDRADSKNPSSTCRGITSSGRPCRRPVVSPNRTFLMPKQNGLRVDLSDEKLYCWQHKEQACHSAASSPGIRPNTDPILEERSSLDTLADRLGIIDLQEKKGGRKTGHGQSNRPPNRVASAKDKPTLRFCFCFSIPLEEVQEPARPKPRPKPTPAQNIVSASMPNLHSRPHNQGGASPGKPSFRSETSTTSTQTARFKHLVPDTLDTITASALMAELARPHTDAEEAGYIYMFWLTPTDKRSPAPVDAARSLLAPPPAHPHGRYRRPSDAVANFADPASHTGKKTMLLKIGRAANVQRRMNQWQRQCGYDIEMLRFYPYIPNMNDRPGTSRTPRMTPHCRRVERLIHIELAGMGLRADMASCQVCGREHREWFQVNATRDGIRRVDDVIRRWVDWDEMHAS